MILKFGIIWKCDVRFMPQTLYTREKTPKLIEQEAGWEAERGSTSLALASNRTPPLERVA